MSRETLRRYRRTWKKTDGWFYWQSAALWDSLLDFQAREGITGDLLEIGVYHGLSAGLMLLHTRPGQEQCRLVDFELARGHIERSFRRLPDEAVASATLIEQDSTKLWDDPEVMDQRGRYRWIHIDGGHNVRLILNDLKLAHELAAEDGVVSVDDIYNWAYPQLTEQLMFYVREHPDQFVLFLNGFNKAYLARPAHVRRYLDHCYHSLIDDMEANADVKACLSKSDHPEVLDGFGIGDRQNDGRKHRGRDEDLDRIVY